MISPELISERIAHFRSIIPKGVELVAVSKFQPVEAIQAAYDAGQRLFGESRVQEFLEKKAVLPADIRWHFIGHLQTNKVKAIIGATALIESIDSVRLLELINRESEKAGIVTDVLMQVHVAMEETKFGFLPEELLDFFRTKGFGSFGKIRIRGLMGMASNTEDNDRIKEDFSSIASLFSDVRSMVPTPDYFDILSMGMSGDWPLAVDEGATIVRIGSAIFGSRN